MKSRLSSAVAVLLLAGLAHAQEPAARRGKLLPAELDAQLDEAQKRLQAANDNLLIVEKQYAKKRDPTHDEALKKRFSDAEVEYLLGNFDTSTVVFYDLCDDNYFKQSPFYETALYYLADSLYQTGNAVVARAYLKDLLALRGPHFRDALLRYLDVAAKTNDYSDIDEYLRLSRGNGGELPPELSYTWGKYNFRRTDLPLTDRLVRVRAAFTPLASAPGGRYRLEAAYFLGVAFVLEGNLDKAIEQFRRITLEKTTGKDDGAVKEQAFLSLGRLYYETGKYPEAVDAYQQIPQNSEYFVDTLYELAWVRVKAGQFESARNATDILLLVAPDATVAPEAQILQGNLLAKLRKWEEATEAYNQVINTYAPVRDEIDAMLTVNKDPVAYFDEALAKKATTRRVSELLPAVALKWATTQKEVADALSMVDNLQQGRQNVKDANEIATRILAALEQRGMETFPELQEGYTRADAVDSAITLADEQLTRTERYALADFLSPAEQSELDALKAQQAQLEPRFRLLPTSEQGVQERRAGEQAQIDLVERDAFKQNLEIEALQQQITAIETYARSNKEQRRNSPADEKAFQQDLDDERAKLAELAQQMAEVRQALADERSLAGNAVGEEAAIRAQYAEVLKRQAQILDTAAGRSSPEVQGVLKHLGAVRDMQAALKTRVDAAKAQIRALVQVRREEIKRGVNVELRHLSLYGGETDEYAADARQVVGRIAFDSFKRVRQQFYDLVLKADVGVVDVAFTRKQTETQQIQKLSSEKDLVLKRLDEEFKEVLEETD